MRRWTILGLAGAAMSVAACASILGIEDGILDTEAGIDDVDSGPPVCISDGGDPPNTSNNVFIAANGIGKDSATCGDEITPCATFKTALAQLHTAGGSIIYASNGTYSESVTLPAGVEIQGGWHIKGSGQNTEWDRVCDPSDPTEAAIITGTGPTTIQANDIKGAAKLSDLWVATKTPAPGEAVYGIFASGSSTTLTLENVTVIAGPGGDGKLGTNGMAGGPGTGACSPGSAITPAPGPNGDPAPSATFGATGVVAEPAGPGLPGTIGGSGIRGTDGGCISCLTCAVEVGACPAATASCGLVGSSGCGGLGGSGGGPGSNGGSSIAVYAWGGAIIAIGSDIKSGKGGNGGAGGIGGSGGEGGVGPKGDPGPSCSTSCVNLGIACTATPSGSGAGTGGLGTRGAAGSSGGPGGGGVGGVSYAIVSGLDASILLDGGTTLGHGVGGTNGDGKSPAPSGDRYP